MRIPAAILFAITAIQSAGAADPPSSFYPSRVVEEDEVIMARPVRRVVARSSVCVRCSRLPLGGLREPVVAHVPLGGLRKSCPPAVVETVRERVVLRVKG